MTVEEVRQNIGKTVMRISDGRKGVIVKTDGRWLFVLMHGDFGTSAFEPRDFKLV